MLHQIIVGNIGTVYIGQSESDARRAFHEYCEQSRTNYGRAAGENVTWIKDGEVHQEHIGPQTETED